jgi:CRISPR system Cascade subunit CasC
MLIEIHILQNFAPSNLNRDDTNTPKDCEFGGVRRARISSQCMKRAIRRSPVFSRITGVELGTRSKLLIRLLNDRLVQMGKTEEEAMAVVSIFVPRHMSKLDAKDKSKTAVLLYFSGEEVNQMVQALLENWAALAQPNEQAKTLDQISATLIKKVRSSTSAPDIAMFGRMLAEKPELNLDAACQVAHSISTHRVTMEMDYFTAVDDLQKEEETGAGMISFTGYNSACFYRYASIHWEQLVKNLHGDWGLARKTVEGFLRGSIDAIPTGKQNSFAANNPPSFILVTLRENGSGWSLANAFEHPVRSTREGGYVATSVEALDEYWGRLVTGYGEDSIIATAVLALDPGIQLKSLTDAVQKDVGALMKKVMGTLPQGA